MRELLERFTYRYRVWVAETRGDKVGAGVPVVPISPKNESAPRLFLRILWTLAGGLVLLAGLARIATRVLPTARHEIAFIVIALATIWSGTLLFMMGGELLLKRDKDDSNDKTV